MIKILIDFDDTIFDTAKFKVERIYTAFSAYSISPEKVKEYYDGYRDLNPTFSFDKFICYVAHEHKVEISEEIVTEAMFAGLHNFTFPFVSKLAEMFGEDNLILLTYGDRTYQEKKVKASGLTSLFNRVEYTEENKENWIRRFCSLNRQSQVVFIDDTFRHFIREGVPKNLTQICVNMTKKLPEAQLEGLRQAGVIIEDSRNKIPQIVKGVESRELKRLK